MFRGTDPTQYRDAGREVASSASQSPGLLHPLPLSTAPCTLHVCSADTQLCFTAVLLFPAAVHMFLSESESSSDGLPTTRAPSVVYLPSVTGAASVGKPVDRPGIAFGSSCQQVSRSRHGVVWGTFLTLGSFVLRCVAVSLCHCFAMSLCRCVVVSLCRCALVTLRFIVRC